MSNWSDKHLEGLQQSGKIRGFFYNTKKPGKYSQNPSKNIPAPKSKAILWLDMNLQLWSNDHALTLEMEYRFCERGWRFDYAWPAIKVALEYEGGIFQQNSGHNTAKHYTKDTEKYNRATVLGWKVIRVTALNYTTVLNQLNEIVK
jgi:hypothetical protein